MEYNQLNRAKESDQWDDRDTGQSFLLCLAMYVSSCLKGTLSGKTLGWSKGPL